MVANLGLSAGALTIVTIAAKGGQIYTYLYSAPAMEAEASGAREPTQDGRVARERGLALGGVLSSVLCGRDPAAGRGRG